MIGCWDVDPLEDYAALMLERRRRISAEGPVQAPAERIPACTTSELNHFCRPKQGSWGELRRQSSG